MSPDIAALLESHLEKLRAEHEGVLLSIATVALAKFDPRRKMSFGISITALMDMTHAEVTSFGDRVRSTVTKLADGLLLPLSEEDKVSLLEAASRRLDHNLYPDRFRMFAESMGRQGGRMGIDVHSWGIRTDLDAARHQAGTSSLIYRTLASLEDDLELVRLKSNLASAEIHKADKPNGALDQANRIVKLEPNLFGIGLNLNYLIRRFLGKKE